MPVLFSKLQYRFKKLRKAAWEGLNPRASEEYLPIQEREAVLLVESLAKDSKNWSNHVKRYVMHV